MTPHPEQPSSPNKLDGCGLLAGGFLGLIGSFFVTFAVGFGGEMFLPNGLGCHNVPLGVIALAVVAALLALAWYVVFRLKARSFWAGFARAFVGVVALMMLIPWPCSLGWLGVASLTCK